VAYVGRGKAGIGAWRDAVAAIGEDLVKMTDKRGRTLHDLAAAPRPPAETPAPPRLLARWDSLLLSHAPKYRDRVIADEHRSAVFSKNADVLPTFLVDGAVAGTWNLARADGDAHIELRPFGDLANPDRAALEMEAQRLLEMIEPRSTTGRVTFTS